jgi:hypothetical protein
MTLNFAWKTWKEDVWRKSLRHLSFIAITSNITRRNLNLQHRKLDSRTLYNSNKDSSNVQIHQSIRVKQHTGRLLRSKLTIISFPLDEKKESSKIFNEPKMTYEHLPLRSIKKISINDLILEGKRQMIKAFMPKGYPDSVTKNYWGFVKWQFLHNVAGSVTGGKYKLKMPKLHNNNNNVDSLALYSSVDAVLAIRYGTWSKVNSCMSKQVTIVQYAALLERINYLIYQFHPQSSLQH